MAEPIYKCFFGRPSEAWYALPKEQQDSLMAKVDAAFAVAGGRRIVFADSSWSSEEYQFFGIEEFPNVAAIQSFHTVLNQFGWLRYVNTITTLGNRWAGEESSGAIHHFFIGRMTEAWYALSKEEQNRLFETVKSALEASGGRPLVYCDSTWASERYQFFGVDMFPDIESVQRCYRAFDDLNWMRYVDTITLLGTKVE